MKNPLNYYFIAGLCTLFLFAHQENTFAQVNEEPFYQCKPCGCGSDGKHFDKPGNCPSCQMKLVPVTKPFSELEDLKEPMNVAILLFHHAQVLDYAGPYDVFTSAGGKNFNVYTVAANKEAVTTMPNLSVNPQYTILNCPKPDLLIIPGGMWTSLDDRTLEWVKKNSQEADFTFSVCTGAFILAETGILDSLEATTHNAGLELLKKNYPMIKKVHQDARFVDNGNVITSAGVSAGIDASLYLVSKILGEPWAEAIATNLEYNYSKSEK
jgi:transcriptional regulator GlxA family with amidase domain